MSDSTSDRLSRGAAAEISPLDDAARARIRDRVRIDGPKIVARARVVRQVGAASKVVVPVLVAVTAFYAWPRHDRACQGFGPEVAQFEAKDDGRRVLELARARFVASADAEVAIGQVTACEATIELRAGRLYVHARDLGGGALEVSTPGGDAVVHGTVFSVEASKTELIVEVAEGVVEVRPKKAEPARVVEGQRWSSGKLEALRPAVSSEMLALKASDRWVDAEQPISNKSDGAGPDLEAQVDTAADPEVALVDPPSPPLRSAEARRRAAKARAQRRSAQRIAAERDPGAPTATDEAEATDDVEDAEPSPIQDRSAVGAGRVDRSAPVDRPATVSFESPEDLVKRGDAFARAGDLDEARATYRRAGGYAGSTAEAAWLALARLELQLGRGEAARQALRERKSRFGQGQLDIEAAWILVRAHDVAGDQRAAANEAQRIVDTWPTSAQAAAAKKWLAQHPKP